MERPRRPAGSALPPDPDAALVELGPIVNLHGIRGELRLLPHNPESDLATAAREIVLIGRDGQRQTRRVRGARRHKRFVLLTLEAVEDADAAEALIGCTVAVPRTMLPPAGPDAAYHADLLGCAVETTSGVAVGTVHEVMPAPSTDVLVVRGAGREHLIPMIADVIASLDVAARRVVIHPLPGLLEAEDDDSQGGPEARSGKG
ncbi:MAG: ribosome maturation factor RimM [Deltaproteobacteria bacterium]|nr:ribosome maturation factor RimM [Deltaproteobacteria bacterium]